MLWLTEDPIPARITAETAAFVVLTMMSAGRSALVLIVMSVLLPPHF
jgi:hypothetical protein